MQKIQMHKSAFCFESDFVVPLLRVCAKGLDKVGTFEVRVNCNLLGAVHC